MKPVEVNATGSGLIGQPFVHAGEAASINDHEPLAPSRPFLLQTIPGNGSYAVSFSLSELSALRKPNLRVIVDIEVERGAIGIGCMVDDCSAFVDAEQTIEAGRRRMIYVAMGAPGAAKQLMLRNGSPGGASIARIHAIEARSVEPGEERQAAILSALWDVTVPQSVHFARTGGDAETARRILTRLSGAQKTDLQALTFSLAVTHTSRVWDWERCTQDFLRNRYQMPGRLDALPLFEQLPSVQEFRSYAGRLTLFDLTIDGTGIHFAATRCVDSDLKANHVCKMGDDLIICFDDCLFITSVDTDGEAGARRLERIDDPWFGGVQMVFSIDDAHCVISASAPDALMVFNLAKRRVVRRWRVPADRYGRNYDLTEKMSVHDHYIANDMQLTHLNCAYPDGSGGFWVSALAQGDIGHVTADGGYEVIVSGFVGCHGVRYSRELDLLYFSDSCTGRLIGIGADRAPHVLGSVESRWLHDSQHLTGDLFLLCLGDRNEIVVLDIGSNSEIVQFDMRVRGENVQFVSRFR